MIKKKITRKEFIHCSIALVLVALLGFIHSGQALGEEKLGPPVQTCYLRCPTLSISPILVDAARAISKACKEGLGFDFKPLPAAFTENTQKVRFEKDFDAWLEPFGGTMDRIDPQFFIYQMHYSKGGMNLSLYKNPRVDELCELQRRTMDQEKRREYVFEAQKLIHQDQPTSILINRMSGFAFRTDYIDPKSLLPVLGEALGGFHSDVNLKVTKGDGYTIIGSTLDIPHLNPVKATSMIEMMQLRLIYDSLFRIGPSQKPEPWMVKSYAIVNPTTINMSIRENMVFHDGIPVTAEDIKFTFDYYKKWKAPYWLSELEVLESVNITGKYSLQFKLKEPFGAIFAGLFSTISIIPKHIWENIVEKEGLKDPLEWGNPKPIGSGPFKFDYWERAAELKLTRFERHFQPPNCKGWIRIKYGSWDAAAGAIRSGACHRNQLEIASISTFESLLNVPNVDARYYENHGVHLIAYNCSRAPFSDPVFRRALAHVLPKQFIKDVILRGHGEIGGSVISPFNKLWHNPEVKPFPEDVGKARQMLKEAGYGWDEKGELHYPPR